MKKPSSVDEIIETAEHWQAELIHLRGIILSAGLTETVKWMFPVYMHKGKNIVSLSAFKEYFGIWFFQGGTLRDELKVLTNAQEGKTKAMRQWRFTSIDEVNPELILAYIDEAIQNQISGNIIKPTRTKKPLIIPPELQTVLDNNSTLLHQFQSFGLGDQRDFADYISNAKRVETKEKRLEKIIPMILEKVGLNDKYKKKK